MKKQIIRIIIGGVISWAVAYFLTRKLRIKPEQKKHEKEPIMKADQMFEYAFTDKNKEEARKSITVMHYKDKDGNIHEFDAANFDEFSKVMADKKNTLIFG